MACLDSCSSLVAGIVPSCDALKKPGGVNKRVWIGQHSILDAYTVDGDLNVDTLTLCSASPANTLKVFEGKKFKNSATTEVTVGENYNTINQSVSLVLYHSTSLHKKYIEDLIGADDLFCLVETNAGAIEVYGIDVATDGSESPTGGLSCTAGTGSTGVQLQDSSAFTITLSGQHRVLSRLFVAAGATTLQDSIDYLDGISE